MQTIDKNSVTIKQPFLKAVALFLLSQVLKKNEMHLCSIFTFSVMEGKALYLAP